MTSFDRHTDKQTDGDAKLTSGFKIVKMPGGRCNKYLLLMQGQITVVVQY